jgi:hypothetical protein
MRINLLKDAVSCLNNYYTNSSNAYKLFIVSRFNDAKNQQICSLLNLKEFYKILEKLGVI